MPEEGLDQFWNIILTVYDNTNQKFTKDDININNDLNQVNNYKVPRLNTPNTPLAHIPKTFKDIEIIDTSPKVENKPIKPKEDFYTMIKNEYNQDEKVRSRYLKLGWWK